MEGDLDVGVTRFSKLSYSECRGSHTPGPAGRARFSEPDRRRDFSLAPIHQTDSVSHQHVARLWRRKHRTRVRGVRNKARMGAGSVSGRSHRTGSSDRINSRGQCQHQYCSSRSSSAAGIVSRRPRGHCANGQGDSAAVGRAASDCRGSETWQLADCKFRCACMQKMHRPFGYPCTHSSLKSKQLLATRDQSPAVARQRPLVILQTHFTIATFCCSRTMRVSSSRRVRAL
jgi:hypothetical protein